MLNKTGNITSPKCYNVCYTDTEKISSPSLLATIMQYSQKKLNRYTRYGNDNEPAARKYFAETQKPDREFLNETGFKVCTEYPYIVTCSYYEIRGLEIKCPYNYQKGLVNWEKDGTFPIDRSNSIKKNDPYYYQMQLQMYVCNLSKMTSFFFTGKWWIQYIVYMYKYLY